MTSSNPSLVNRNPEQGEMDLSKTLWDKNDFIESVRSNKQTLEPVEVGHRSISLAQIGLIACQVGGKLKWNPEAELFEGDNYANALLTAPLPRKQWDQAV